MLFALIPFRERSQPMEHVFDVLSRLGEVTLGLVAAIFWFIVIVGILIELVDFLIVDPIRRTRQLVPEDEPTPVRKQINLPQSGADRDVL